MRDEAAEGRDRCKLIPVSLDGVKPPMGFSQYQTLDLSKRRRGGGPQDLDQLLRAVDAMAAGDELVAAATPHRPLARELQNRTLYRPLLAAVVVALIIGIAFVAWRTVGRSSAPVVAVVAAERSPQSVALARDLLVKLGSLHSAKTHALRLTGPPNGSAGGADLVFEASGTGSPRLTRASLSLVSGNDRSLLWSRDFVQQSTPADLEQQMAYAAGQVLACALEASEPGAGPISQDTLRVFLSGCELFGDKYRNDPRPIVPILSSVVAKAPRFQPAWRKLLLAESNITRVERQFFNRFTPGALPQHIAQARKLNREIPEIYVAESELLSINAYARRFDLVESALSLDPENPALLVVRSELLLWVGRMNEAVDVASHNVELDPLSPTVRGTMIGTLAYAGRIDSAYQELQRAEELWPGATVVRDSRLRLDARYGDARNALRILKSEAHLRPAVPVALEAYLLARIEPTEANVERAIAVSRRRASTDVRDLTNLVQLMGQFHREAELYELLLQWPDAQVLGTISEVYFRPPLRKFRQDPRFMRIAARARLVDYWRKSGKWPDFCFESDLPYDCKKEAAKLNA